jgi:hypothetical protein
MCDQHDPLSEEDINYFERKYGRVPRIPKKIWEKQRWEWH